MEYSSPLPPSSELEGYSKVYSRAAEIIFNDYEKRGAHSGKMDEELLRIKERKINKNVFLASIGQWGANITLYFF